jgi:hypothetical protein
VSFSCFLISKGIIMTKKTKWTSLRGDDMQNNCLPCMTPRLKYYQNDSQGMGGGGGGEETTIMLMGVDLRSGFAMK